MASTDIIILFIIIAIAALFTVSMVNASQTRKRLIKQRLSDLKRKIEEMEEIELAMESLLGSTEIPKVILEERIDILKGMLQLDKHNATLDVQLNAALEHYEELSNPSYRCQLYRIQNSDAQIARAQYQLSEAGRIVRKRQVSGHIEVTQMNSYIHDLAWANMMVQIVTLIAQGHKAANRGDILRAYAFYKKALEYAMSNAINDQRRHQLIKETSDMANGARKYVSLELMPESDFNPDSAVAS